MDKIYRNSVSVDVALSSATKRLAGKDPVSVEPKPEDEALFHHSRIYETAAGSSRLKGFARPFARFIFRLSKPLLKPIAFRLRQYLARTLLEELETAKQSIKHDIVNARSESQRALESMSLSLRTLERMSRSLSEEVREAREEVREARELMAQAMHASRSQTILEQIEPTLKRVEQFSYASARRFAIPCGDSETLVRTSVGYVLCTSSDHALLAQLIDTGDLEPGTRQLIQRFLNPGDLFVDVGANVGLHTIAAARAMQGIGKIIAFEPFEVTKRLLEKTAWINGFSEMVEVHHAAVSHQSGHEELFLGATSGHHSLYASEGPHQFPSVQVPTVRLDDVIGKDDAVSLLKIDVEGAELDVIRGAVEVIRNNPDLALIVEFGASHLKHNGHSPHQWISAFTDLGLTYCAISESTGALENISLTQLESVDSVNLFFARPASRSWSKAGHNL
jgi:FkbM family methyltransferase